MDLVLDGVESVQDQAATSKETDDYVVLSTIHSAKGREWDVVRILNLVDGCIPSKKANTPEKIEEERRVLHVAMTRAKDQLDLIVPGQLFRQVRQGTPGSLHMSLSISRFLPKNIHSRFRCKTAEGIQRAKASGRKSAFRLKR
jgi:DNA helicase-2/ATP-dependent DNA helicase PcrA